MKVVLGMSPVQVGAAIGAATGIVGPLWQTEQDGAPTYYWNGALHDWLIWYALADVAVILGWGFGALGVEWVWTAVIATLTHGIVAYIMGWVIETWFTP